jgi:hypothetical protein
MNCFLYLAILTLIALPLSAPAADLPPAERFHNGLSLQGFTGILNTPNAYVTKEGDFYFQYTNQKESTWRDRTPYQDNYLFSVGAFSILELGGRLTWAPAAGAQDLSANVKFTTEPFFKKYPIPVLAIGMQDVSGGAAKFKTKYAVLSDQISILRLSVGYGTGPDRMKGVFAGGELKAHDWIYLLADYDTRETNVGARVVLPYFWKVPISFTATAKSSINHQPGNVDIAFGLSLPLDFKVGSQGKEQGQAASGKREELEIVGSPTQNSNSKINNPTLPTEDSPIQTPNPKIQNPDFSASLEALRDRLVRGGFVNVRVGAEGDKVAVLEYENSIFNHNEMDALGVVAGMAAEALKDDFDNLRIIIKKKNIRMMQLSLPLKAVTAYMENGRNLDALKSDLIISSKINDDSDTTFVGGEENSSLLTTSLVLWPGLSTWVGTDYGAFDYVLSLKPDLYVNLWKGGLFNARWDIPLFWSDNLNDGKPFRDGRTPARMERLMFFQGIKLLPGLMLNLGGGMLVHDMYGTMNELVWQPGSGNHRVRLAQSWGRDDKTRKVSDTYLASYRYYFSPLDVSLEGTAGKFWAQDRGFTVELKRFFGDAAFSVYYKNTTIKEDMSQGLPRHWQAAGVQFAFPLTPEKDMKHYYKMQLRGTEEWSYSQETVIAGGNSANANYLPPVPLAVAPNFTGSLNYQYLNRDRLNESYITSHLDRLRDAWIKYKDRLK